MKTLTRNWARQLAIAFLFILPATMHADVIFNLGITHGYDFYYPSLQLTVSNPAPVTYHRVESPDGLVWRNRGANNDSSSITTTNSLSALINQMTNGLWKLYLNREHASEELYQFRISISGVTSNIMGNVAILFPSDGSTGVTNLPTFHWTGPSNLPSLNVQTYDSGFSYFQSAALPSSATNWTPPSPMPNGASMDFYMDYRSNNFAGITFTTPTNGASASLTGWMGTGSLTSYGYSSFTTASAGGGGNGHTLLAHYSFEDGSIFTMDDSLNGNNIPSISSTGGGSTYITNAGTLGSFSAFFNNNGGAGGGWLNAPSTLLATLADSFSISLWVQTTQVTGSDTDTGLFGNAGLVAAFNGGGGNWVVPMALTGSKVTFATGGSPQDYLHSTASITNASSFVHVVVTRSRTSGQKKIYVNGSLDATSTGSTELLNTPMDIDIGYNNGTGLNGKLDEIQFYSGILSADDVDFLYNNPGSSVPNTGADPLAQAVDAEELVFTTGGDADWFSQTITTYDSVDAAQSGAVGDNQYTWIETTVEGPGELVFWWKISSDDFDSYDYLELSVDENYEDEIVGEMDWTDYYLYLGPGTHTIRWTYWKDSDFSAGDDAAWLDAVTFTPEIEVELDLTIERNQSGSNTYYYVYPYLNYVSPDPTTAHEVESPNNLSSGSTISTGSTVYYSLQEVIDELEGGDWRLYINRGSPSERLYTFTVTVNSLTTNDLPGTTMISPLDGATGVATNVTFNWIGPTNFNYLFVNVYHLHGGGGGGYASLSSTVTSWSPTNGLAPGTNNFYVGYTDYTFGDIQFSDAQDASFNYLSSWSPYVTLSSSSGASIVVSASAPPPTPVQILAPQKSGSNLLLSWLTQSNRTHNVECRTNLTTGMWQLVTNFVGNGTVQQIALPITTNRETYYRIGTQ